LVWTRQVAAILAFIPAYLTFENLELHYVDDTSPSVSKAKNDAFLC
jgi:hypothetical protein